MIAVLMNPDGYEGDAKEVEDAALRIGQKIRIFRARDERDIDTAFRSLTQDRIDAMLIVSNPLFTDRREQIVTLANYFGSRPSIRCASMSRPGAS